MVGASFRLLAKSCLPLAFLFILAACGGSTKPKADSTRVVAGTGFSFQASDGWQVRRTGRSVVASSGANVVSVTRYQLLKPYDPSRFAAASRELDRLAAKLAAQSGGTISERRTTTVDGRRIRAYRFDAKGVPTRVGFVLDAKTEYQLMCSGDTGEPCDLLFSSFRSA
jgi:hypothetical protein